MDDTAWRLYVCYDSWRRRHTTVMSVRSTTQRWSQWIESLLPVPTTATSHVDRELIMQWTDAAQSRSSLDVDSQLGASRPHACQLSSSSVAVSLKRPLLVPLSVCLSVCLSRSWLLITRDSCYQPNRQLIARCWPHAIRCSFLCFYFCCLHNKGQLCTNHNDL